MSINSLISSSLRGKKLMFLSVGFMVVFVCGVGLNPVKAQEIPDTVKQDEKILQDTAPKKRLGGRVVIEFIVDVDGNITDVKVIKSSGHPELDEEAVRVVQSMPKWNPGKVPITYRLPIKFKLGVKNKDNKSENEPLKGKKNKK